MKYHHDSDTDLVMQRLILSLTMRELYGQGFTVDLDEDFASDLGQDWEGLSIPLVLDAMQRAGHILVLEPGEVECYPYRVIMQTDEPMLLSIRQNIENYTGSKVDTTCLEFRKLAARLVHDRIEALMASV